MSVYCKAIHFSFFKDYVTSEAKSLGHRIQQHTKSAAQGLAVIVGIFRCGLMCSSMFYAETDECVNKPINI